MIDHMGIKVADRMRSKAFYTAAFAPLGFAIILDREYGTGFGAGQKPDFWLIDGEPPSGSLHIAFQAADRAAVDAFYAAAIAAGGRDNGPPGPRPQYHPGYYGAFVYDPDGYNIEAVCHRPPAA